MHGVVYVLSETRVLYLFFKIILFVSTLIVSAVLIQGPKSATYPAGTDVTLTCYADVKATFQWMDDGRKLIFYGNRKETKLKKYHNFYVEVASGNSNMTIIDTRIEDEGIYSCTILDKIVSAYLSIEGNYIFKLKSISFRNMLFTFLVSHICDYFLRSNYGFYKIVGISRRYDKE